MIVWLDLETRSDCDIKTAGGQRYAEDPSTQITLFGYAIDDAPAKVWDLTQDNRVPQDLLDVCGKKDTIFIAHNSAFDRTVLKHKLSTIFGDVRRWQDTMIRAYSVGLPGSLGQLSRVLGMPQDKAKDQDGRRLVMKFCKPHKTRRGIVRYDRTTDPEDWTRFVNYCRLDVEAMREMTKRVPAWNCTPELWSDWHIDQDINDRGICLDNDLVDAAVAAAEEEANANNAEISDATAGFVDTTTKGARLMQYLLEVNGIHMPDMKKTTIERYLADVDLPEPVRELLALRLQGAKASIKKYVALSNARSADGRLRGTMQFMGAMRTGRWAGRIFQPQNLPRGTLKPKQVDAAIKAIKSGCARMVYDDLNAVLSSCIRGCVVAPKGKKLVVADLSNIEGRVIAWLAGEEWKLEAFRKYDRGEGPDIYVATYAQTFGVDPKTVDKGRRQIGKVLELALGYEGGVGAFLTFAVPYHVDLDELAVIAREAVDPRFMREAAKFWEFAVEKKITHGLKRETFIACDAIKRAWRARHPKIVQLWRSMGEAAVALASGGTKRVDINKRVFMVSPYRKYITTVIPSGRGICYPGVGLAKDGHSDAVTYMGISQTTRQWGEQKTYSGKLVENLVQSVARDILMRGIANAEAAGYEVVMHVHDEIIAEAPDTPEYSAEGLAKCMTSMPEWAEGLPLAAAGFEGYRYRKD